MRKPPTNAYEYAIRSIPILCTTGLLTVLIGHLMHKPWAMALGTCLFLAGFAVWGLANGGAFLWGFLRTLRRDGFRVFVTHPWSSAFYVLLMLFLLYAGGFFIWFAIKVSKHAE